jgi:hypothetical protein
MLVVSAGKMNRPVWMIVVGFVMVLVGGIVMPYLMLPGVAIIPLESINETLAWFLLIFSYGLSVSGLFLGTVGAVMYVRIKRPPRHSSNLDGSTGPLSHS